MKSFFTLLLLLSCHTAFSQNFLYLEDVKLAKKADFIENEANLNKAVEYLMTTPVEEQNFNRKACTRFIIRYAEKTPFVTISLSGHITKLTKDNPALLEMYIGLWVKHAIANKTATEQEHEHYIVSELYKYAKEGNNLVKNDVIKSLVKAGDENTLDEWLTDLKK